MKKFCCLIFIFFVLTACGGEDDPNLPENRVDFQRVTLESTRFTDIDGIEETLYAVSGKLFLWTEDFGGHWGKTEVDARNIYDLEIDGYRIYLATDKGVLYSNNAGQTFQYIFRSNGYVRSVDCVNGICWAIVAGQSGSGVWKQRNDGLWSLANGDDPFEQIPFEYRSGLEKIILDVGNPSVAYTYGYDRDFGWAYFETHDSGQSWYEVPPSGMLYSTLVNGKPWVFGQIHSTDNQGISWKANSVVAACYTDEEYPYRGNPTEIFVGAENGGVYSGESLDSLSFLGLQGELAKNLKVVGQYLFVITSDGALYRADIHEIW